MRVDAAICTSHFEMTLLFDARYCILASIQHWTGELEFALPHRLNEDLFAASEESALSVVIGQQYHQVSHQSSTKSKQRIHFSTNNARNCVSGSKAGATNMEGSPIQHDDTSTTDWGARKEGGEMMLAKLPFTERRNFNM